MNVRMSTQHSDTLEVGAIGVITYIGLHLIDVDTIVRIVGGLLTIWFVCYKFYKEFRK